MTATPESVGTLLCFNAILIKGVTCIVLEVIMIGMGIYNNFLKYS